MKKIMLINMAEPEEQRMAIVEDGLLQELDIERSVKEQIKGNIYRGKVTRVEPAIQAAFVDFGGNKSGFLSISELDFDILKNNGGGKIQKHRQPIQDILKVGSELLVQVIKEERDAKGPTLTTYISLPGKYMVLLPGKKGIGISRKIEDEKTRRTIREMIGKIELPDDAGVIIRTAGAACKKQDIVKDIKILVKLWNKIKKTNDNKRAPYLIYQESSFIIRALRDRFDDDISQILIDDSDAYIEARDFLKLTMPHYLSRLKLYSEKRPLFTKYNLEEQIEKIYLQRVPLKCGGGIVMQNTEAMVTIDVNSGKFTRGKDIEETAFNTNMEAADEIARQIRLRDLGGLIVVDFIDMRESKHRNEIEKAFKNALKRDRAKIDFSRISKFGLVELSRQRIKPQITEGSYQICPNCRGQGMVISAEMMAVSVYRKIHEVASSAKIKKVEIALPVEAAEYLKKKKMGQLRKLEEAFNVNIDIFTDFEMKIPNFMINSQKREIPVLIPQAEEILAAFRSGVERRKRGVSSKLDNGNLMLTSLDAESSIWDAADENEEYSLKPGLSGFRARVTDYFSVMLDKLRSKEKVSRD